MRAFPSTTALAACLLDLDCACFTPNDERLEHIVEMARGYNADGVIHYALQFCGPYTIVARKVETALKDAGVPLLKLETDYSMEDMAQLETRVQAFLEVLVGAGAWALFPGCRTVLDVGGQDTKVMTLDAGGRVEAFEMNDRCAAVIAGGA